MPVAARRAADARGGPSGLRDWIAGIVAGMLVVLMFSPLMAIVTGSDSTAVDLFAQLKKIADIGFCGVVVNVGVFTLLSTVVRQR